MVKEVKKMDKLTVVGICLMVVSIITGLVTRNGLFIIPMWLGLFIYIRTRKR